MRRKAVALTTVKVLLVGMASSVVLAPVVAIAAERQPSVPGRSTGQALSQPVEPGMARAPKVTWPRSQSATLDVPAVGSAPRAMITNGASGAEPADNPSVVSIGAAATAVPKKIVGPIDTSPASVRVEVLDRKAVAPVGGVGMGLKVTRKDGVPSVGTVNATLDYSGFAHAYGGDFASRLRLVQYPACAVTTPHKKACGMARTVPGQRNDVRSGKLTAPVQAAPDAATPRSPKLPDAVTGRSLAVAPAVYALVSGSSSDAGDYRATAVKPSGKWDVALSSGAFTYSVPIEVPQPPMGMAPELSLSYNSQSVDGRTSASNNQASWVGMGWDLNVGAIERRYINCADDGHKTFGDLCWDSPNSTSDPNGAVYTIQLDGVTSELIQDGTGTGSFRVKDDPGWRVQKLNGGYGSDNTDEYWVVTKQDGTRYYFGWGRTERLNLDNVREKTNSVLTVPVIGDDEGEPCHASYPEPCKQAWRWSLDRVVTSNEVENSYFYNKETNHYRSVAAADKARGYDAGSYLSRIDYGWSSQIPGAQLPAMIDFQHVNRCVERMTEKDPLNNVAPDCPTIDAKPASYPDVPVDLICDGPEDGETCAGKTYYPTFFQRDMLWDITVHVRDTNTSGWDLVKQYQFKYALMNPSGSVGDQLWLDYIQRRGYAGDDIDMPTINFNGEWQDNKVGSGELNFRRVNKIFTDAGSTVTATYGHATDEGGTVDRTCPEGGAPSESDNHYECFWQKWVPEGADAERTGWFKKFVTKRVQVDPGKANDGAPPMITDYEYDGAPGWRYTDDPLVDDDDETWSDWRGYGKVLVTTGANENKHSTYHWLYRGLNGGRTSKTDASKTASVKVADSDAKEWTDSAWLAGQTLETSSRDHNGDSQEREWHEYWAHNTAQYTGLPDARMVREDKVRTLEKVTNSADGSGWREHIVETEYDDAEKASTVFGLPMRVDDWGETNVSDNSCTEYGRAYNTDDLTDADDGAKRWMVYQDDERHYSVSCSTVADDETAGAPAAHMDKRVTTFYDGALSFAENDRALVDGNVTEVRTYTSETAWHTMRAQYDAAGRQTRTWDGKNQATMIAYRPQTSWPVDGITTTTPDPDGSGPGVPLTTTRYLSRFWGQAWKTVDANGNTTQLVYDAVGRLSKVFKPTETANYPDGTASMTFDYQVPVASSDTGVPRVATGDPVRTTTRVLQSGTTYLASYSYSDGLGRERETQTVAPEGTGRDVQVTRYDSSGNVAGTSAVFYNSGTAGSGLVNPAVAAIPSYTDLKSDWAGRTILSQIQAKGVVQASGKTVTQYQGADEVTVFPPVGSPTKTVRDAFGLTSKVVENLGAQQFTTTYEYTRKGQLKYVHDAAGNTSHYAYDWAGERVLSEEPDTGRTTTGFDANGQIQTVTDQRNITLTYDYDTLNRPTTVKQGASVLTEKSYDTAAQGKGLLATATSYGAGKPYTSRIDGYDVRGRATAKTFVMPDDGSGLADSYQTKYHYDLADHVTAVDYPALGGLPAETVTTTYKDGRATKVASPLATYVADVGYDNIGRLTSRSLGTTGTDTSVVRRFGYEDANGSGWLKNITTETTAGGATKTVQNDSYTRNNGGQVTALREGTDSQQQCFTYDELRRITGAWTTASTTCTGTPTSDFAGPDPYQSSYTYDRMGNIQSVTDKASASAAAVTSDYKYPGYSADESTYTPDQARPHAVTGVTRSNGGTDTYSYNDAGQMTGRTVGSVSSVLDWDARGNLTKVTQQKTSGNEVSTYVYDADGNPVVRNTPKEKVLYLEGTELHRTDKTRATRYYAVDGSSVAMRTATDSDPNGKLTWLLSDGQASTQLMITAVGGVLVRRRTTPFGKQRGTTANLPAETDRGFVGKAEDDSTGLSLMGARVYDPSLGRFLSTDPVTTPEQPQTLNLYSYARNNPVNLTDSTGLYSWDDFTDDVKSTGKAVFATTWVAAVDTVGHGVGNGLKIVDRLVDVPDPIANFIFGPPDDPNALRIGWEWATDTGPRHRDLTGNSRFTKTLKSHAHVKATRTKIAQDLRSGKLQAGDSGFNNYSLGGPISDSIGKLYSDFTSNLSAAFLGSYKLKYKVTSIDKAEGTARVRFTVKNESTINSATHLGGIGYGTWWAKNIGDPLDNELFKKGVMSKRTQTITWTETIHYGPSSSGGGGGHGGGGGGGGGGGYLSWAVTLTLWLFSFFF
ncbi:RHS repeat-associated core domain-containing protein [Streptomyces sp. NPDC102462]|uniref:RHS repeat-associated core domain-containing protein n=1 Tax=Streptomyces sp. NPDC102462 TaxID=3366178 RepID=UPI00380DECD2